jgi:hypothetical protein
MKPMTMRRGVWVLAGSLLPGIAWGQAAPSPPSMTAIDVQNFWPAAGPQQAFALQSNDVQPHLSLGFGVIGNFMYRPLVLTETTSHLVHPAVDWAITTDFVWGIGLFDRIQIAAAVPLVVAQSGEGITALVANGGPGTQLPQTALRDLRFDVGVAIIRRERLTNANGFGLRINVGGAAPIGDEKNFQGANSWTFSPLAIADYRVAGLTFTVNAGARIRETAAIGNVSWGHQLVLGVGAAYRPIPFDRLSVGIDYIALVPLQGDLQVTNGTMMETATRFTPMELYAGARLALDRGRDIELSLGAGAPLTQVATVPQVRVILGFAYSPHGYDNDRDHVPDAEDTCPTVPEDRDGFQDNDGCVDPDNDGDTILDANDRCPNAPEDVDNFEDADGCPDPDNDRDGVNDPDDECATEPAGEHPDAAHPGCPVRDRDRDGVLDSRDACMDVPAGDHPDPRRLGCPLPDVDHDGVRDSEDLCPSDPAGDHADRFRPGCPDADRDHDGVVNEIDRCPDQPETINGVTDDDGCPDNGPETVTMAGNAIIVQPALRVRPRARSLSAAEQAILAQAAQRIRARGGDVVGVRVRVVPGPGAASSSDATRLAGLIADSLATRGITRSSITAEAAAPERAANVGEVRIIVEPRGRVRASGAPSAAPATSPGAGSSVAPRSGAPSAAPATSPGAGSSLAPRSAAPSAAPGAGSSAAPSRSQSAAPNGTSSSAAP